MKSTHRIVIRSPLANSVKTYCGLLPEEMSNSLQNAGLDNWRGVTCKNCLKRKKPLIGKK